MKKKLMSLCLTLALALTLAVPALAVDVNSPDYMAGYSAGYDKGYDKGYDEGYDEGWSVGYSDGAGMADTEYQKGYDESWSESYDKGYLTGQRDAGKGVYTEQPYAEIRDDYDDCTYEDGMADGAMDGFADGYESGIFDKTGLWGYQVEELLDKGGKLGQVNVVLDGDCVSFPDTQPKIVDGRTMLPVRAVTEGLGMEVAWDAATKTVTISQPDGDTSVAFVIGSETAAVTAGGETTQLTMDCAAYLDGGRTMVPLRFLSEGLGYTVLWDDTYRTVAVVDKKALAAEIDAKFTKLNEMSAKQKALVDLGESQKVSYKLNGTFTHYDETGTANPFGFGMDMTLYTDGKCLRAEMTLNLKDIASVLMGTSDRFEDTQVNLKDWMSIDWSKVEATFLLDKDGQCWLNAPALNLLFLNADKKAWLELGSLNEVAEETGELSAVSLSTANLEELLSLSQNATVGEVIVTMLAEDEDSFHFADNIDSLVSVLEPLYGDSVAQSSTASCTWTLDADRLLAALGLSDENLQDMGWVVELAGRTVMDNDGNTGVKGSLKATSDYYSTVTGSLDVSGTPDKATAKLSCAMADLFDLSCTMTCTAEKLNTLPSFAVPAGVELVKLSDLMTEDVSNDADD